MENQKKYFILGAIIFFTIFGIWIYFVWENMPGKCQPLATIVDNDPLDGESVGIDIDINFYIDKPISLKRMQEIQIETLPHFNFKMESYPKVIKIIPKSLKEKTNYKIIVKSKNPKCSPITNLPFEINFSTGTKKNYSKYTGNSLQFKKVLPIINEYYNIDYWPTKDAFLITLKKDYKKAKEMALKYLVENGVNIQKIEIIWFEQ